jgi:hypothetical protein
MVHRFLLLSYPALLHPYADNAATAIVVIPLLRAPPAFLEGAVDSAAVVAEVEVSPDAMWHLRLEAAAPFLACSCRSGQLD